MQKIRDIPVAGRQDDPRIGQDVRHAKTFFALRARVADAARSALAPHLRRPTKGSGKWPRRIKYDQLRL